MKEPVRITIELVFAAAFAATLTFLFYTNIRPAQAVHTSPGNGPAACGAAAAAGGGANAIR